MSWWVACSEPGRELYAAERLADVNVNVYCPTERVTRRQVMQRHGGWRHRVYGERVRERHRVTTEDRAILPRYLFAEGEVPIILATRGVAGVLKMAGEAYEVSDRQMDAVRAVFGEAGGRAGRSVARLSEALRWRVGDRAVLRPGTPFAGFEVVLRGMSKLDTTGEIEVWLTTFGQQTRATLKFDDVDRVIPGKSDGGVARLAQAA